MASRMDKYYSRNTVVSKRSKRNEQLYREIYENANYSNIEAVATIDKGNEIDINKVKEMLRSKEEIPKERKITPIHTSVATIEEKPQEKNYDIRDILNKAKEQKKQTDKYHALNDTDYDVFKDLRDKRRKEIEKEGTTEQNLRKLIDTITSTSELNKLEDSELSLDLLDDLKSSGNTVVTTKDSVKAIIEAAKKEEKKEVKPEMDHSFYTAGLNFKEEDFEELANINTNLKKNNNLIKILIISIVVILAVAVIVLVFNLLK